VACPSASLPVKPRPAPFRAALPTALLAAAVFLALGWSGMVSLRAEDDQAQAPLPTAELDIGPAKVTAELARTPAQLEAGLMFRRHMDDNAGMLFMLGPEQRATFWMKNTVLPLSVAYIDRMGRIAEIYDMQPFDTTPIFSHSDKIMYALEMNQGWFVLNKIAPGTVIRPAQSRFGLPPLTPAPAP